MSDVSTPTYQTENIFVRIYWWFKRIPREITRRFEKSNYEKHAIREFEYAGWSKNGKWDDDMQEYICKQILQLLRVFSKHGHSGSSHDYALNLFKKLASFEPVGAITCEDYEWNDLDDSGPREVFQNKRLSSVFKNGVKGKPYYLNAITWQGEESYDTFSGQVEEIKSRQFIKLPFSPKTFYIDVVRRKVDYDDKEGERVVQCDDGNYVYAIKDRKQLLEVAEYYDAKEMVCE